MTEQYPWFGTTSGPQLEQGDFLFACPNYQLEPDGSFTRIVHDCIVLSHSCDLSNDKLTFVQVCPIWSMETMESKSPYFKSAKGKEELRRGNVTGYHLINRCSLQDHPQDFVLVDFRSLFGIPLDIARQLAISQSPRLRLLPPYREHLAQAFARFFMRIGLPVDLPPFKS